MATLPFPCTALPLSSADFQSTLNALGADAAAVWALLEVESGKAGYLPDRRPQILFERAVFHTRTKGQFDATHPGISAPTWGGYSGGAAEYTRLAEAYALSPDDALQSASWGIAQVMGFNFSPSGSSSAQAYVQAACASEGAQLQAFQSFLLHTGIAQALSAHDWNTVALHYNGSGQVAVYAGRLAANYAALQDPSKLPNLDVRAAQLYLTFLANSSNNAAFNPNGIDGLLGPGTLNALHAFQTAQGLAATSTIDDSTVATLTAALPAATNLALH
ncbi:N-acetylmuramidase domain-containing protein [Terracidiphilus sp.]|jgi:peptidoglycan hydrolase-like protein with peptidoglycan-binding domain|uniref:N-acetylmuramidase domain-containing protein n=1 Tax=Terracidiphilus sp. TaxID=1964191 RepID=UPI003C16CF43